MILLSFPYATDEDVVLRASADFTVLTPRDQCLAAGTDGTFGADPWTLASASVDFAANGVAPGQVVRLTQPITLFKPPGDCLVVDSVVAATLTTPSLVVLRRKGMAAGVGQPPAPGGNVQNVEFTVTTLTPQITQASADLNRRLGIDPRVPGRRPGDIRDPRELTEAVVLTVLYRQYTELSRGSKENTDAFLTKGRRISKNLTICWTAWSFTGRLPPARGTRLPPRPG